MLNESNIPTRLSRRDTISLWTNANAHYKLSEFHRVLAFCKNIQCIYVYFFLLCTYTTILLATEEPPAEAALESLFTSRDITFQKRAEFIEEDYQSRGFHRVKGEDPPDWNSFLSFSSKPDFSDLRDVLKLDRDEIAEYGHQKEDLILQCTYNDQQCNMRYKMKEKFVFCLLI